MLNNTKSYTNNPKTNSTHIPPREKDCSQTFLSEWSFKGCSKTDFNQSEKAIPADGMRDKEFVGKNGSTFNF